MLKKQTRHATARVARRFSSLALTVAVATTLASSTRVYGHGAHGDDDLSQIPVGGAGLLPDDATDPVLHGQIGPLLPTHTMGVHQTLLWKRDKQQTLPKILMFHRHSAYRADEVANPDVIDFLLRTPNPSSGKNAIADQNNQLNSSFRRSFVQLCYGGYNIIHDVSQSVPTRIGVDQTLELTQLWDLNHPLAFKYNTANPKYSAALLNNSDAELNLPAFKNMGYSKGLYYDMYCPGFATLTDGRAVFMGGHDMNSQNGSYRIQIFDPETETWAPRPISCMRDLYGSDPNDPYFENLYQAEINRLAAEGLPASDISKFYLPIGNSLSGDCNPHDVDPLGYSPLYPDIRLAGPNGTVTHPGKITSDMKYARWYPTCVTLPTNQIYVFAGWDRDEVEAPQLSAINTSTTAMQPFIDANLAAADAGQPLPYPDVPVTASLSGSLRSSGDANFLNTRVKIPTPEVYDAKTDTTIALENARLHHAGWYPNGVVVQTGPGRNDWKVAVLDGEIFEDVTGGVKPTGDSATERYFTKTFLVDVQGALKDKDRDKPQVREGKYLQYLGKSFSSHSPFSANASMIELDKLGRVVSHTLTHFGGVKSGTLATGENSRSKTVEQIDFANLSKRPKKKGEVIPLPEWKVLPGELYQEARQNYATPLPDGKVVILGGNGGSLPGIEAWSMHLQLFDPATGTVSKLAKSLIPRDEHGIIQLMPDATVYLGGQNRNGLVRPGDAEAPLGDSDLGVPCGQFFRPPHLFDKIGRPAERPIIAKGPELIDYGKPFKVGVYTRKGIKSVALIRTGSMSHSLNTDLRYVKVPFKKSGATGITVYPPKLPGTAIPGYYMLFVVDEEGVPSEAKKVVLGRDVDKRIKALSKAATKSGAKLAQAGN